MILCMFCWDGEHDRCAGRAYHAVQDENTWSWELICDCSCPAANQGLPPTFLEHAPLTLSGKILVVGNGVPLPMGRAVAKAVKRAVQKPPAGEGG